MTATEPTEAFQVTMEEAEAYEAAFVPALFAQWAPILCDAAGVESGRRILDVACGTGIVARTAAGRVGASNVVGLDLNDAMLSVARRVRPDIEWRQGDVLALPYRQGSFDAALCQMALMFFPDIPGALREMARVVALGGTVAFLVPRSLDAQPAYGPFVEMAARHAGSEARALLGSYFACGELDELVAHLDRAGLLSPSIAMHRGKIRFPSVDALVTTEVDSTPLGQRITAEVRDRIHDGARDVLAPFTTAHGSLEAPFDVLVVTAGT